MSLYFSVWQEGHESTFRAVFTTWF